MWAFLQKRHVVIVTLPVLWPIWIWPVVGAVAGYIIVTIPAIEDRWKTVGWATVICSVLTAFFAFVIGGWVAGRLGGFRLSEPAMLHGAIAWLVAVPLLLAAGAAGGSAYLDNWYGALGGTHPTWTATAPTATDADVQQQEKAARAARNAALTGVTALLLGLVGSVLGGWMASGEPMTLTHHLRRANRTVLSNEPNGARSRVTV